MDNERRHHVDLRIERRAGEQGRRLVGYAAVFNTPTTIGGRFVERIAAGAFKRAVAEDDVRALIDHDPARVLGRSTSGTLRLAEDATGLRVEIDPPDTSAARDLLALIERGDVTGMSFGFQARGEDWDHRANPPVRTVTDAKLFDVSVVTYPAYPEAGVALRSMAEHGNAALRETLSAGLAERLARLHR